MTPDQAQDLATRIVAAIRRQVALGTGEQEFHDYCLERVASDLAGLRFHPLSVTHEGWCSYDAEDWPCADYLRYADGLRRTAALYGVEDAWDGTFTPPQQALHDEVEANTEDLLAALARAEYLEEEDR